MLRARPRARGGSASVSGYYIALDGVYGGSFNDTLGTSGNLGTAATNLTGTITWAIEAGSDARISINASSGVVATSSGILLGDSAAFTVTASNGVLTIGFPFTAVGTVTISQRITLESGTGALLLENGSYLLKEAA